MNTTQEKILNAAKYLYRMIGYQATTFQMIVDKSGLSRSVINYYYPKKQDILVHILNEHMGKIKEIVEKDFPNDPLTVYMCSYILFSRSLMKTEELTKFQMDSISRRDRTLSSYRRNHSLMLDIVKLYDIDVSDNELLLFEVALTGAINELKISHIRNITDANENEIFQASMTSAMRIIGVPKIELNNKLETLWDTLTKYDGYEFNIFDTEEK